MKLSKEILEIAEYISHRYTEPLTPEGELSEEVILDTIKAFSQFDYDSKHKLFTRDINGAMFGTENVELDQISSIADLYQAISYLQNAYDKRYVPKEKTQIKLDEQLYNSPTDIKDISRKEILGFLKQQYDIDSEKQLYDLEEGRHKNVVYDIYRNFTGYIPVKESPHRISFKLPEETSLGVSYNNLPNFENDTTLFAHIRTMRDIKKNAQQLLKEVTPQRLEELKNLVNNKEQEEDIER